MMRKEEPQSEYREELAAAARAYRLPMRIFLTVLVSMIVALCLLATLYNAGLWAASVIGMKEGLPRLLGCAFGLFVSAILVFFIRDLWMAEAIKAGRATILFDDEPREPIQPPESNARDVT